MDPYYTIMKLPGSREGGSVILLAPFTPSMKDNMSAWMAARCDAPSYGKVIVYKFPKQKLVYGPRQIEARIDQDTEISKQLTLWQQKGIERDPGGPAGESRSEKSIASRQIPVPGRPANIAPRKLKG